MCNFKQESSQEEATVIMTKLCANVDPLSRLFWSGVIIAKRLPYCWGSFSGGGILLPVLGVLLTIALISCSQPSQQLAHSGAVPTSTATARVIPTPAAKELPAQVQSGHNVNISIAKGVMYAGTNDQEVYALRITSGSLLWHTRIEGSVEEVPVVVNGVVYVSSLVGQNGPSHLSALRASDGTVLWYYTSTSYIYAPIADNGIVYIATQYDGVTALRANDGVQLWHFRGSTDQVPSVSKGVLYIQVNMGGKPDGIYALRAGDGTLLWNYPTSGLTGTFTLRDGEIYVLSENKLSVLRAKDGHHLWSRAIDGALYQPPQFFDGVIYLMATKLSYGIPTPGSAGILSQGMTIGEFISSNELATAVKKTVPLKQGRSSVYALRASDGMILWQEPMNRGENSFATWFLAERGVVYAGVMASTNSSTTGTITALHGSDGMVLWQDIVNGTPSGTVMANGMLYINVDTEGRSAVYSLRAEDGTSLWSYPIGGDVFNGPALVDTTVYVGAGNGIVYALQARDGTAVWHYRTNIGS